MKTLLPLCVAIGLGSVSAGAMANTSDAFRGSNGSQSANRGELPPYLQCVPYARQLSGIQIYGDAHTWWKQAAAGYARGKRPKVGAVMAFRPHRNMRLGHVAAVSRVIDSRTILLDHANWSPINGRRGQIERNVRAVDVSEANDWSRVRVWYDPIKGLGKTQWPVHGFIYGDGKRRAAPQFARSAPKPRVAKATSPQFLNAFASLGAAEKPRRTNPIKKPIVQAQRAGKTDPLDAIVLKYGR